MIRSSIPAHVKKRSELVGDVRDGLRIWSEMPVMIVHVKLTVDRIDISSIMRKYTSVMEMRKVHLE